MEFYKLNTITIFKIILTTFYRAKELVPVIENSPSNNVYLLKI